MVWTTGIVLVILISLENAKFGRSKKPKKPTRGYRMSARTGSSTIQIEDDSSDSLNPEAAQGTGRHSKVVRTEGMRSKESSPELRHQDKPQSQSAKAIESSPKSIQSEAAIDTPNQVRPA